jgi:hypothetical protein
MTSPNLSLLRLWSVVAIALAAVLWLQSGSQKEKSLLAAERVGGVRNLEALYAKDPQDGHTIRLLAEAYLDADQSGYAEALLARAPKSVLAAPSTRHLFARVLVAQGKASEAIAQEDFVLELCPASGATGSCPPELRSSAEKRRILLAEMVRRGIEDIAKSPETAALFAGKATVQVRVAPNGEPN